MLTKKYLNGTKNLDAIMHKIIDGTAPDKFTTEHLKKLGFKSSNDRAIIGLLKDLGFLTEDGTPTQRYHEYRDTSRSKQVLGEAIKDAYQDIFHVNEKPSEADKKAICGVFKTTHNVSERVAGIMTSTFLALLSLADINTHSNPSTTGLPKEKVDVPKIPVEKNIPNTSLNTPSSKPIVPNLRYNIEIHLPATKDIEVYNSIFKSLREHLLDD